MQNDNAFIETEDKSATATSDSSSRSARILAEKKKVIRSPLVWLPFFVVVFDHLSGKAIHAIQTLLLPNSESQTLLVRKEQFWGAFSVSGLTDRFLDSAGLAW